MTLSREEIRRDVAVRMACALIARDGYDDEGAPRDAVTLADALLAALTLTPAPVAPPAGKYELRVGDRLTFPSAPRAEYIITEIDVCGVVYGKVRNVDDSEWGYWCGGSASEVARHVETWRSATPKEREDVGLDVVPAAGLAVPPPATAGEDRSRGCVVAFCADHSEVEVVTGPFCPVCSMGRVLDDGVRLGRTAKWPTTPAPEAKCEMCGGPHVRDVFHAADLQPPAPEAKRPTHVRVLGMALGEPRVREVLRWTPNGHPVVKHDCIYGFTSLQPGEWEPAPCPPPVAGSAEDDVERAARALVENRGATYSVATNPPSKFVMIPSAYFEALRAALSRPVRP